MLQAEQLDGFETTLIARWRVIAPMMPPNGDLRRHLAQRRSMPDVLEKRRSATEIIEAKNSPTNLHLLSGVPADRFPDVTRARDAA